MIARCSSPTAYGYEDYGGRGIAVCERWRNSYEEFLADMGRRPTLKHTLDRKDSNGNYGPDNCRWATRREQARNRRSGRMIEYQGVTLCLAEWAEKKNLIPEVLKGRLDNGWPLDVAMETRPLERRVTRTFVMDLRRRGLML